MSTQNLKRIIKAVNDNNISAQVVPSPSNSKNSYQVICNGITFKSSQWTNEDIENFVQYAQGKIDADVIQGASVALQKINTAHGTTAIKEADNYKKQNMTYADDIQHLIQLKGRKFSDVLNEYIDGYMVNNKENSVYYYKNWFKGLIDVRRTDLDLVNFSYDKQIKAIREIAKDLINKKQVVFYNEMAIDNYGVYKLIKNWHGENDIQINENKLIELRDKVMNLIYSMGN